MTIPIVSLFFSIFLEWTNQDVVEKYLKPINMEHMAKAFMENNINGAVLLALEVYKQNLYILQDLNHLSSVYYN